MKAIYLLVCLPFLFLVGCVYSPPDYFYLPHPGVAEVAGTQPSQGAVVTTSATIAGVTWPDDQQHLPGQVQARLRVHNNDSRAITFDPHSISLTTADMVQFPAPMLNVSGLLTIGAGETVVVNADFPLPGGRTPDQMDLSSLQLRWSVGTNGGSNAEQMLSFQRSYGRAYRYYDDPYWDGYPYRGVYPYAYPYPVVGGGVVIRRRW